MVQFSVAVVVYFYIAANTDTLKDAITVGALLLRRKFS
jgi:hypothetical protein